MPTTPRMESRLAQAAERGQALAEGCAAWSDAELASLGEHAPRVRELLRRHYGYDALRPLQAEAIGAGLARRDSLVVLPTGGGKSLCYQMPALVAERIDVVVSPLIALMKDQVDGLVANGVAAAALHSGMTEEERGAVRRGLGEGRYRLLFVSPERLASDQFVAWLGRIGVRTFAVDEAHCISQWGHDFRPEYRQLARLRELLPDVSLHAFTATATPRVRGDIRDQLRLRDPVELVGDFDRPNLTYRIVPRTDPVQQALDVLRRHDGEAAIIYCLSRRETEAMSAALTAGGLRAGHYHAGLSADERRRTQDAFAEERLEVVVATVAFGMGIDRGDVRCVLHTAMPKSVEHYQQETGRAGRDGLEAECVLLHSSADASRWERLMRRSLDLAEGDHEALEVAFEAQLALLRDMQRLCVTVACRHRLLCAYFGQTGPSGSCGACDCCLGEIELLRESTLAARQILSAVARTGQRFGVGHVADVLRGVAGERIRELGHDQLSVFGLMRDRATEVVRHLIHQHVDHGLLVSTGGDRPTLALAPEALPVLRGEVEVTLVRPRLGAKATRSAVAEIGMRGVDRELFDSLRALRRGIAERIGKPPYVVFGDETLREMARVRPATVEGLRTLRGIGAKKLRDYGDAFFAVIDEACRERGLGRDMQDSDGRSGR